MKTLTVRELEVAELVTEGLSNQEIASRLFISVHTVKSILENIFDKIDIHNRVQLAVYYCQNNNS